MALKSWSGSIAPIGKHIADTYCSYSVYCIFERSAYSVLLIFKRSECPSPSLSLFLHVQICFLFISCTDNIRWWLSPGLWRGHLNKTNHIGALILAYPVNELSHSEPKYLFVKHALQFYLVEFQCIALFLWKITTKFFETWDAAQSHVARLVVKVVAAMWR